MQCPRCGSQRVSNLYRRSFSGIQTHLCGDCGFQWMYAGPSPIPPEAQEARENLAGLATYCYLGIITCLLSGLFHLSIILEHPIDYFLALSIGNWLKIFFHLFLYGLILGSSLYRILRWLSIHTPKKHRLHIIVPLIISAIIGGFNGLLIQAFDIVIPGLATGLRSELSFPIGIVMAMAITPIIIIRSHHSLVRRGYRKKTPKQEDSRWHH